MGRTIPTRDRLVRMTLHISQDVADAIEKLAAERETSQSALIRRAIAEWLAKVA